MLNVRVLYIRARTRHVYSVPLRSRVSLIDVRLSRHHEPTDVPRRPGIYII